MAMIGAPSSLSEGSKPHDFFGFAALREHQHHVVAMDAAQIAVNRFGRVQEMAPRAGRSERGRQLLPDQSGLADAGDDHAAAAKVERIDRVAKLHVQPVGDSRQGLRLELDDFARVAKLFERRERAGQSAA